MKTNASLKSKQSEHLCDSAPPHCVVYHSRSPSLLQPLAILCQREGDHTHCSRWEYGEKIRFRIHNLEVQKQTLRALKSNFNVLCTLAARCDVQQPRSGRHRLLRFFFEGRSNRLTLVTTQVFYHHRNTRPHV